MITITITTYYYILVWLVLLLVIVLQISLIMIICLFRSKPRDPNPKDNSLIRNDTYTYKWFHYTFAALLSYQGVVALTVSFHNFKSHNFKLSVSNPKSKYVAYVYVLSRISNCQGLGHKNKHEIWKLTASPRFPYMINGYIKVILIYIYIYIYIYTHIHTHVCPQAMCCLPAGYKKGDSLIMTFVKEYYYHCYYSITIIYYYYHYY